MKKNELLEEMTIEVIFEYMFEDKFISKEDARLIAKGRLVEEGVLDFTI